MALFPLINADILCDGLDLSPYAREFSPEAEMVELDKTTFASAGWREYHAGLRSMTMAVKGPQDFAASTAATASTPDETLGLNVGTSHVLSAAPLGATETAVGYFSQGMLRSISPILGQVGELGEWSGTWRGTTPLVRGTVASAATITATGTGTIHQLGAVAAGQRVWAALHLLTAGGTSPSITVTVQSAAAVGFASPTLRVSFAAATAKGGQFGSTLGPITDQYWRASWTVSGTSPSFQAVILIGIQ